MIKKIFHFFSWICLLIQPVWAEPLRTIRDDLGRIVTVPPMVKRVLSLQPEITRIIIALGAERHLVGLDYFLKRHDHFFRSFFPRLGILPELSNPASEVNVEAALGLSPDVIFTSPDEFEIPDRLQEKMEKPVIALASLGRMERLLNQIDLVGQVLDRNQRASELIGYFQKKIEAIQTRLKDLTPQQRPRIYLSLWGNFGRTPVYYEPINLAGGRNCAETLLPSSRGTVATTVSLETILLWDPDFILLHGNYPVGERVVSRESLAGDPRFRSLSAWRRNTVQYTFGFWYWWDPAQVLLEIVYLAKLFHPDRFPDVNLWQEGDAVYRFVYNLDQAMTHLDRLLHCREWFNE